MKISAIRWQDFSLPLTRSYESSEERGNTKFGLLLALQEQSGKVGFGESSPIGLGNKSSISAVAKEFENLGPSLLNMEINGLEDIFLRDVDAISPCVRFGIETALLDLWGKITGSTAANIIGIKETKPIPCNAIIATNNVKGAVKEAVKAISFGFTSLKLKVGQGSEYSDEVLVSSVREAIGPKIKLRIDANQAWTVKQAIRRIQKLEKYTLEYVEQPSAKDNLRSMKEISESVEVKIAADESLGSLRDLEDIVNTNAADILIVKPSRIGGFSKTLEVISEGIRSNKSIVVTTSLDSSLGISASVTLASSILTHSFAHGLSTGLMLKKDLTQDVCVPKDGFISVAKADGIGIRIDIESLKNLWDIKINKSLGIWQY